LKAVNAVQQYCWCSNSQISLIIIRLNLASLCSPIPGDIVEPNDVNV
jgi:hypothetical protein